MADLTSKLPSAFYYTTQSEFHRVLDEGLPLKPYVPVVKKPIEYTVLHKEPDFGVFGEETVIIAVFESDIKGSFFEPDGVLLWPLSISPKQLGVVVPD